MSATEALVAGLNPAQRQAVEHGEGPLLIFAGAGSGKTRVITHRIAYLIRGHGVPPASILGVTFTNKAAGEMAERLHRLLGPAATLPWIRTFHATCARWLREHIALLSPHYDGRFTVLDESGSRALIAACLKELDVASEAFKPAVLAALIDRAKDHLIGPERFAAAYAEALDDYVLEVTASVYKRYQEKLERSNSVDFGDLIRLTVRLFEAFPEVLARYRQRYRFLLVDEYQDTNPAQYALTRLLAAEHRNLCVVGDDDQAIFTWRGADPSNLLEFERDFPEAKVITLGKNYRCSGHILQAANGVILHNSFRQKKRLEAVRPPGERIRWYGASTQEDEARFICSTIDRLHHEHGVPLGQIAVLYRVNTLSRQLEETLIRWRIPYEVVRGLGFYERQEVKDVLAYLRLLVNPHDEASLLRVINRPRRGIGARTLAALQALSRREAISLWEALTRAVHEPQRAGLGRGPAEKLRGFLELMAGLQAAAEHALPSALAQAVLRETRYVEELERSDPAVEERLGNLQEFLGQLVAYEQGGGEELSGFLEEIALVSDADRYEGVQDRVALLTLHAAKGLEFEVVFLMGLEEGLLPHARAVREGSLEEERRLCYVGMTRAKERLYLSWATERQLYGTRQFNAPSRFLGEIPSESLVEPLPPLRAPDG